ncbi:response regulator transcription factor, partial [Tenacibaculum sp.]|nr:response regulator transcription factor [Tenacibaculum sp.]
KPHDIEVVGSSENGLEVLEWLKHNSCDILMLDISMPECNGIEVLKELHKQRSSQKVIIVSSYDEVLFVKETMKYAAKGFILKEEAYQCMVKALYEVYSGNNYYSDKIKENIINVQLQLSKEEMIPKVLSKKELDVLKLLTEEYSSFEISQKLKLSLSTIRTYTNRMREKLDVKTNVGLVKLFFNSRH